MTYRPAEMVFGPPWSVRLPSLAYLGLALLVAGVIALAEVSPSGSSLRSYFVEQQHLIGPWTFALVLIGSALASLVRASMRGVRIRGDSVEYRDVVSLWWPKVKRYKWAQIDQIILDSPNSISLDLWDGTRAFLPDVSDRSRLAAALEKVAAARAIPVRGGAGIDEIPESTEFDE